MLTTDPRDATLSLMQMSVTMPAGSTAAQAEARGQGHVGTPLDPVSPAPLRLAVLMLVSRAYERDDRDMPIQPVEAWIAPYRAVRL